jgi:hypothetical protein
MSTARSAVPQELSTAYVREIFKNLESGDGKGFFDHVADNVDWIVEGTHPLAGHYHSKTEFLAHTFEKLAKVLPKGAELQVATGRWSSCIPTPPPKTVSGSITGIAGYVAL